MIPRLLAVVAAAASLILMSADAIAACKSVVKPQTDGSYFVTDDCQPAAKARPNPPQPAEKSAANQERFIRAVIEAREVYRKAPHDLAAGAARVIRKQQICAALGSASVRNWEGTIYDLSSNSDGKGVLTITIGPHVWIKTWNNSLSDIGDNTLLSPSSPVYAAALSLRKGQKVRFSGSFIPNDTDCVREGSLTQNGSMTDPEFIMRFTELGPADTPISESSRSSLPEPRSAPVSR